VKKIKNNFLLLFIVLITYAATYLVVEYYKNSRVNEILTQNAKYLELSYKQGLDRFHVIAENVYLSMQNDKTFVDILASVNDTNIDEKHVQMYSYLKDEFFRLKLSGVFGVLIASSENKAIVRMHKEEKYGDNLTLHRPIVTSSNEQKVHLSGFEEGKSSHAFRQVYPLYKNGRFIGVMDIFFSSTKLQDYTMRASNIHTHFIVNKKVFKTNEWKSHAYEPYEQSIEHKDFLFSLNDHINHDRLDASAKDIIKPLEEEITQGIDSGESFNVYHLGENTAKILNFLPVNRFVDNKTVAYMVSYLDSKKLYTFLQIIKYMHISLLLFFIMTYLLLYRLLMDKEAVLNELKYDNLTNIYNRKYFMKYIQKECSDIKIIDKEFCIVMADIDYFKKVNDTYGHQYGDVVLQEFASILKNSIREMDKVARYGGEEFIIFLLAKKENSARVVEEIRKKIENYEFGEQNIKLTASFGIAQCTDEDSAQTVIARADGALYKAKEYGRNQIQIL